MSYFHCNFIDFITARVAKVMFSQPCITHSVQVGEVVWSWGEVDHLPSPPQDKPLYLPPPQKKVIALTTPSQDRPLPSPHIRELQSMGERYASYWSAFLFTIYRKLGHCFSHILGIILLLHPSR